MDPNEKVLEIHRRLCRAYGCPIAYFHALDPLSELVSSLLSHRTRNADSGAAFKALRARFPEWAGVLAAPEGAGDGGAGLGDGAVAQGAYLGVA